MVKIGEIVSAPQATKFLKVKNDVAYVVELLDENVLEMESVSGTQMYARVKMDKIEGLLNVSNKSLAKILSENGINRPICVMRTGTGFNTVYSQIDGPE